jgi:prolipoprotein diacylglyceryltransferase
LYWKTEKENTLAIFLVFLVLLFSVRIVVESVKESQGGFESCRITFYRSVVEYSILIGLYFVFTAKKNRVVYKNILLQNNKALSATEVDNAFILILILFNIKIT